MQRPERVDRKPLCIGYNRPSRRLILHHMPPPIDPFSYAFRGAGLLLLRISVAILLMAGGQGHALISDSHILSLSAAGLSLCMCVGLLTPVVALAAVMEEAPSLPARKGDVPSSFSCLHGLMPGKNPEGEPEKIGGWVAA